MFDREGSSGSDDNEKHVKNEIDRRGSKASVRSRVESLDEIPDPDAGKSVEERAKIVCVFFIFKSSSNVFQDRALLWKVDRWLIPW